MLTLLLSSIEDEQDKIDFEIIYNNYNKTAMAIAYNILGDFHLAEDAVQNAFFALAKHFYKIRMLDELAIKSYIYKTTKNAAIDIAKKEGKRVTIDLEEIYGVSDEESDVLKGLEGDEKYNSILKAVFEMPDTYRDALAFYYINGLSIKEISEAMQKPVNTVKSHLSRGTKILREKLMEMKNEQG